MQGLIQWGARGAMPPPPSSGKVPQILDQMSPESGQKCPNLHQGKMPHILYQSALVLLQNGLEITI